MKSLLVAAGLFVGASAWAGEVTTIYSKALDGWSSDDVTKTENTVNKWYNSTGIVANDYLTGMMIDASNGLRLCARQTTATATLTLDRTVNTIVTIDAVWNTGSESYPNNANCNSFIYGDFKFDFYTRYKTTQYTINGVTKNATVNAASDEELNIHLVVNSVSGEISALSVSKVADPTVVYVNLSNLDATNNTFSAGTNYDAVTIKSINSVSKNYNYTSLKSITVKQETQSVSTASVTFKYVDTEGNDLSAYQADQVQNDVAVGAEISGLIAAHTKTFYNGDDNKYIYANDYTVEGNYTTVQSGGNTVTLKFTDYPKTAYTVMAKVDGADLVAVASGSAFLDGSATAYYSRFATKDGLWYETTKPYRVAINKASVSVDYTKINDDVVYCSEAEDIDGLTTWSHGKYVGDMSKGSSAVFSATKLTTLEAGTYTITGCAIGRANDRYIDFYKNSVGDANKILRVTSKNNGGVDSGTFTLTESTDIIADGGSAGGDNGHACDYVYIVKLPATVAPAVTDYATYSSPYALNFAKATGVQAYVAKSSDGSVVTMEKVDGAVPANTGLLLQKMDGEVSIPVVAEGDAPAANLLKPGTGAAVKSEGATMRYVLAGTGEATSFYCLAEANAAVVIPEGKAYLEVVGAPARLAIAFEDSETTGIATVENANVLNENFYNLNGQRIVAPQKGVYIVNGKKVVLK